MSGLRKKWNELLKKYGIEECQGVCNKKACRLENPVEPLFEIQDEEIEGKEPQSPFLWYLIMSAGDVYRSLLSFHPPYPYFLEQIDFKLDSINFRDEKDEEKIKTALSREGELEKWKWFKERVVEWKKIVEEYPSCEMEIRKKMLLEAINLDLKIINNAIDGFDLDKMKKEVNEFRKKMLLLYPMIEPVPSCKSKKCIEEFKEKSFIEWSEIERKKMSCQELNGTWDEASKKCILEKE